MTKRAALRGTFLERICLSGNAGPMHHRHTGALVSQVSCTQFLSLTLDMQFHRLRYISPKTIFALDEITSMRGDNLILLSSPTPR